MKTEELAQAEFLTRPMRDGRKRSLLKTITWRVLATIITVLGVKLISDDWGIASSLGIGINLLKMGFYYFHERVWNRVKWGCE